MDDNDAREIAKIADVLERVVTHLDAKDRMNAALHMSNTIRPTPLAVAVQDALQTARELALA